MEGFEHCGTTQRVDTAGGKQLGTGGVQGVRGVRRVRGEPMKARLGRQRASHEDLSRRGVRTRPHGRQARVTRSSAVTSQRALPWPRGANTGAAPRRPRAPP